MICYLSDSYIAKNPQIQENMKKAKNRVFTNDLVFDFLLDILGITTEFNSEKLHLLSDSYSLNMENGLTLHGRAKLESREVK